MNLKKNFALTLMELLISSVLIGIVGAGAVGVDMAVRQMREGASRNAILAMRTSSVMVAIAKNVSLATGDTTDPLNIGIDPINGNTFCERIDPATLTPPIGFLTPGDYSDDYAVCYTWDNVSQQIHECQYTDWNTRQINCQGLTATNRVIGTATNFQFNFVNDPINREFYLEVTITDCFDPSQPCGTTVNPEYTLTSRINPSAHSY